MGRAMNVRQKHDPVVICRSCGAEYSSNLPNCPYCGTMNLPAAESAYMHKLEHMRRDLEGLGGLADRETKKGFRTVHRIILLASVLLCLFIALFSVVRYHRELAEAQREKEEYLWQREAFAEMEEEYSSGDYDSLLLRYRDAQNAGHHVWEYKRSEFCDFLMMIENTEYSLREYEAGSGEAGWLLRNELYLYQLESLSRLSEEERSILERLRAPLLEDLDERFQLTEDELSGFKRALTRDGVLSIADCERFLEERGVEK